MSDRINEWRAELDSLSETTGITLEDVCKYTGVSYTGTIGFYHKIPRKRETFIEIGMAFRQDVSKINDWISGFGDKRKLYAKEALSDLVWIYLINCNRKGETDINFFSLYEECRAQIQDIYVSLWDEYIENDKGTRTVENDLTEVTHDDTFRGLRGFVAEHMDAFKTAYRKPRSMLAKHVKALLGTYTRANDGKETPVNFLRGYLDDSMMNYITGDPESINVIDMKSRDRVINIKTVPKLKRTHIALCLALGMTTDEINDYLDLMGYRPLSKETEDEGDLINALEKWDREHPLTRKYKEIYLWGGRQECEHEHERLSSSPGTDHQNDPKEPEHSAGHDDQSKEAQVRLTIQEELQAVSDMLMMRSDLDNDYRVEGKEFPYMKE